MGCPWNQIVPDVSPYLDTTDRSHSFATAEHETLRVIFRFPLETGTMTAFDAICHAKKQRSPPTLPRRDGKSLGLAHRQRPSGLKQVPARYFEQNRMKYARASAYPQTAHTHHTL